MFPWKYFFSTKLERSKKTKRELVYIRGGPHTHRRVGFYKGRFPYSWVLLTFENTLKLTPF
jgi:hypothetical protein